MSLIWLIVFTYISVIYGCDQNFQPGIQIGQGRLQGTRKLTTYGLSSPVCYDSFKGIPYAKAPLGKNAFKAPLPAESWDGIRDASKEGNVCLQLKDGLKIIGNIDCLFLNIYVPVLEPKSSEPLPVIFYIHGGGFVEGSGNEDRYGPQFLLQKNIILVTMNYRLGIFGFLSLGTPEYPGNVGLKDQRLAIQWVYDNIAKFNGNPEDISLIGHSAGGMSTHLHVLSPSSKYFKRAVLLSGTMWGPFGFRKYSRNIALEVARGLNCSDKSDEEIIQCFENLLTDKNTTNLNSILSISYFFPTIEPKATNDFFINEDPIQIMKEGKFRKIPVLCGVVSLEYMLLISDFHLIHLMKNPSEIWSKLITTWLEERERPADTIQKMEEFYFKNSKNVFLEFARNIIDLNSDMIFIANSWESLVYMSQANPKDNYYFFEFSFEGNLQLKRNYMLKGVWHAEDLNYLFYVENLPIYFLPPDSPEKQTVDRFTTLLTNFAKTGIPCDEWPPIKNRTISYLNISGNSTKRYERLEDENTPIGKRMKFHQNLFNF